MKKTVLALAMIMSFGANAAVGNNNAVFRISHSVDPVCDVVVSNDRDIPLTLDHATAPKHGLIDVTANFAAHVTVKSTAPNLTTAHKSLFANEPVIKNMVSQVGGEHRPIDTITDTFEVYPHPTDAPTVSMAFSPVINEMPTKHGTIAYTQTLIVTCNPRT